MEQRDSWILTFLRKLEGGGRRTAAEVLGPGQVSLLKRTLGTVSEVSVLADSRYPCGEKILGGIHDVVHAATCDFCKGWCRGYMDCVYVYEKDNLPGDACMACGQLVSTEAVQKRLQGVGDDHAGGGCQKGTGNGSDGPDSDGEGLVISPDP